MGEKVQFLLLVEFQWTNVEGKIKIENHLLTNNTVTFCRQKLSIDAKIICANLWWEIGYFHHPKVFSNSIRMNYKGGNSNFTVEKLGRYHLTQV